MKKYISYEEGSNGTFTLKEMQTLYKKEVNKEEYATFETWLYDMIKSGVFEEMKEEIKVMSGTFENGCGVMVWNKTTDTMYHKLVFEDAKGCYIEIENKKYYKEDLQF